MIRPLDDDDVEFIMLHYKIDKKELPVLMGSYLSLVDTRGKDIINLCFYEYPCKIIKVYGSADNFIDYLEVENGAAND